jgi:negative regulator of flagellin synthesis FlgM
MDIMKIDSSNNNSLAGLQGLQRASSSTDAKGATSTAQQTGAAGTQKAAVSLSALSSDLRTSNASDIDTAKVESIKSALRDGTYTIDSSKIADGMLSNARDLLQTKNAPTGV